VLEGPSTHVELYRLLPFSCLDFTKIFVVKTNLRLINLKLNLISV